MGMISSKGGFYMVEIPCKIIKLIEEFVELASKLDYFPLTENQLGVYYECMQNPDEIRYTMPTVIRFGNDVEANKLKDAVMEVALKEYEDKINALYAEYNNNPPIDKVKEIVEEYKGFEICETDPVISEKIIAFYDGALA